MRKWISPQSRCIFCTFRIPRSRHIVQDSFRSNFSTSPVVNESTKYPNHQKNPSEEDGDKERFRIKPRRSEENGDIQRFRMDTGRPGKDGNTQWFRMKPGRPRESREPDIISVASQLEAVKTRLSESGYDCDGSLWETFSNEINRVVSADPMTLTKDQSDLRKSLLRAHTEQMSLSHLQSLFIDRYLDNQGLNVDQALANVADLRYPTEWFTGARSTQRDIHLHIGPTNSGKTYNALKRLEESGSGFYAGPLRLLAHEVYSRFRAKGLACDLITGDDVRLDESTGQPAKLKSSTVEMVETQTRVEVAVIDEIQMMADPNRGWAWTRAFLGACANEVHICGENRVLPLVQELVGSTGDTLHVHEYKRLNELRCMSHSLNEDLTQLRPGDAVICFSVVGLHAMKKQIETTTGKRCAIVYGSLPPETRALQAALFNEPDNQYDFLVASDAVGMGLNLSIKRIIFESVHKYNGVSIVQLSVSSIKQIAGRAGRFRTARDANKGEVNLKDRGPSAGSVGLVTTLRPDDLPIVRAALAMEAEPITQAGIMPPGEFVEDFAARLPANTPHVYVLQRLSEAAAVHPRFTLSDLRDQTNIAQIIEHVRGLSTGERHVFTASPFSFRGEHRISGERLAVELAEYLGQKKPVSITDVKLLPLELLEKPLEQSREFLHELEFLHQGIILYLWLSYRMNNIFRDQATAFHAKTMVEERINMCLESFTTANRRAAAKLQKGFKRITVGGPVWRLSQYNKANEVAHPYAGLGEEILDPLPVDDPALSTGWERQSSSQQNNPSNYEGGLQQPERAAGSG